MADEIVLQSNKFKVVRRLVDVGKDTPIKKELIIHPGSAVILPILDDGKVIMVKNWRWSIDRELLELPAGTIEPLEEPEECACRELEEETGYIAGNLRPLCRFYTSPGIMTELMHVFVATDLKRGKQHLSEDEKISTIVLSFNEINAAIRTGRIMDGKTLTTLLYYQLMERP